jgi:hypothetical protein
MFRPLYVSEHRFECRHVAVNIGDGSDTHSSASRLLGHVVTMA